MDVRRRTSHYIWRHGKKRGSHVLNFNSAQFSTLSIGDDVFLIDVMRETCYERAEIGRKEKGASHACLLLGGQVRAHPGVRTFNDRFAFGSLVPQNGRAALPGRGLRLDSHFSFFSRFLDDDCFVVALRDKAPRSTPTSRFPPASFSRAFPYSVTPPRHGTLAYGLQGFNDNIQYSFLALGLGVEDGCHVSHWSRNQLHSIRSFQ